jgi:hypothetical protein
MDRFVVAATDVGDCQEMLDRTSWEEPKSSHIGSTNVESLAQTHRKTKGTNTLEHLCFWIERQIRYHGSIYPSQKN